MANDRQHDVMHRYYEVGKEAARLSSSAAGRLELERTQEIVLRHLPEPPATVADIGRGPGRYALWLARLGYHVVHGIRVGWPRCCRLGVRRGRRVPT
jgi:hypothetical protein